MTEAEKEPESTVLCSGHHDGGGCYIRPGVSGARPIAAKPMGVDRRHIGLRHVTHAPATPWD